MKKLIILFGLLLASPSFAADNAVIVTPGVGVTMKSKDIGAGVQAMQPVLSDTGGNALSTPTAGADAVSNTSTGLLAYDRLLGFNGTTWDRLQVDANKFLKMTLTSGALIDLGAQADAAAVTDNSTASLIALLKRTNQNLTTLNGTAAAAVPAGPNLIGYISNDPCKNATVKAFLPITATTSLVKVIATGVSAKKIYICQINLVTTAANNVGVFEATTGTTCATSPVAVYGAATSVATAANGYPFPANGGISLGNGDGTVGITTVNNNDLCIATSAATPLTGGITYATQ